MGKLIDLIEACYTTFNHVNIDVLVCYAIKNKILADKSLMTERNPFPAPAM